MIVVTQNIFVNAMLQNRHLNGICINISISGKEYNPVKDKV